VEPSFLQVIIITSRVNYVIDQFQLN